MKFEMADYWPLLSYMPDIWQTMTDIKTITMKENVRFHGVIQFLILSTIKFNRP